jgi:ribonuclease Z
MPAQFRPRLVHGPFEDPGLFIPFPFERRAILFDLGDLSPLPARDLLKISQVFVTHTHMDHFIGFDQLLRCVLGREKDLDLYGPAGFIANVEGKLAGYSWDLVDRFTSRLSLHLTEVRADRLLRRSYQCGEGFAAGGEIVAQPFDGRLHTEPSLEVRAAVLPHSIPCLGLALAERFHVTILTTGLKALGLAPGPWIARFKRALYAGADPQTEFRIEPDRAGSEHTYVLGVLAEKIARITPGQKIAYVTDVGDSPDTRAAVAALARDADHLFIEAAFLESDRKRAAATHHLTARQAGELAALARARRFTLFHFSPRYEGREAELLQEAQASYQRTLAGMGSEQNLKGIGHSAESKG